MATDQLLLAVEQGDEEGEELVQGIGLVAADCISRCLGWGIGIAGDRAVPVAWDVKVYAVLPEPQT